MFFVVLLVSKGSPLATLAAAALLLWSCIMELYVAARALVTYLIPGCVGRGVRLGSESSSGGVWKSGNLEIWGFEDLGIWRSGDLEVQKFRGPGNPENWGPKNSKTLRNSNLFCPKMSARSGLVGKNPPGPIWSHLQPAFPWTKKKGKKNMPIVLGGPMGPIHLVWALAAIHPRWGNR